MQPIGNNAFLMREEKFPQIQTEEDLRNLNRAIVRLSEELGKPCVATGDVHFKEPEDEYYRRIVMASQNYSDADLQAPLYFKTTEEMLDEFSYLGTEKARDIVIVQPSAIAEQCEMLKPFPFETCAPYHRGSGGGAGAEHHAAGP